MAVPPHRSLTGLHLAALGVALLAGQLACSDFTLGQPPADPSPVFPAAPKVVEVAPGEAFALDRILITGSDFGPDVAVTVNGVVPVVLVAERERLVVEMPDLGSPTADVQLRLSSSRGGAPGTTFEYTRALKFLGAGQPRSAAVIDRQSLVAPLYSLTTLRSFDDPAGAADGGTPASDGGTPDARSAAPTLKQLADDIVIATGNADFAVPFTLRTNLVWDALENARPFVAVAAGAKMVTLGSGPNAVTLPLALVLGIDSRGLVQRRIGGLFQFSYDSGTAFTPPRAESGPVPVEPAFDAAVFTSARGTARLVASPVPGELGRLVVLVQNAERATLSVYPLTVSFTELLAVGKRQGLDLVANGEPQITETRSRIFLSGVKDSSGPAATQLFELSFPGGAVKLSPVALSDDRFPPTRSGTVDSVLPYAGDGMVVLSFTATADDSQAAISFLDGKRSSPRLALLSRGSPSADFRVEASVLGASYYRALTFATHAGGPALYGFEASSGSLVRLARDLRVAAAFPPPGGLATSARSALVTSGDGERLLLSDAESGAIVQFASGSESFLPPLSVSHSFGPNQLPRSNRGVPFAVNASLGESAVNGPGQLALLHPRLGVFQLGGRKGALCGLAFEPDQSRLDNLLFAIVGSPAREITSSCSVLNPCPGGARCVAGSCVSFSKGELRVSIFGSQGGALLAESDTCYLGDGSTDTLWTPRSVAVNLADFTIYALLTSEPPAGTGVALPNGARIVKLGKPREARTGEPFAAPLCEAVTAAETLWRGAAGVSARKIVVTPDGRALGLLYPNRQLVLASSGKPPQLIDFLAEAKKEATTPEEKVAQEKASQETQVAVDGRPCTRTFKPAVWATNGSALAFYPLDAVDASGGCGGPSTAAAAKPLPGSPRGSCFGLFPTPNGRGLLAMLQRGTRTILLVYGVERDASGSVTGLLERREVELGKAPSGPRISERSGISFSSDGATAYVTVNGDSTLVSVQ